jgi:hypothetical protein
MVEVGRRVAHQAMHVIWVDQTPGWGGPQFSHIDKAPADNSTLAVYFDANTASGLFFEGPVSSCNTSADNWTNGAFEALVMGEWSAVGASTAPPREGVSSTTEKTLGLYLRVADVDRVQAIRYGFSNRSPGCVLRNSHSLPMATFSAAVIPPTHNHMHSEDGIPPIAGTKQPRAGSELSPPRGWSSWNYYSVNVNENIIRMVADVLSQSLTLYEYVNLDGGWVVGRDAISSDLLADPVRFPSGMKALADYIHQRGLKFGMYTSAGEPQLGCRLPHKTHEKN